ncbi:unnamed protein product, partial [Didymodactylos carnosus]
PVRWGCGSRPSAGEKFCQHHTEVLKRNGQKIQQKEELEEEERDYTSEDCTVERDTPGYSSRSTSYGIILTMFNCGIIIGFDELFLSEGPLRVLYHLFELLKRWSPLVSIAKF